MSLSIIVPINNNQISNQLFVIFGWWIYYQVNDNVGHAPKYMVGGPIMKSEILFTDVYVVPKF